jgi:hypothetical protein
MEIDLQVNGDKTKNMVMSEDQNAECHGIKADNSSFVKGGEVQIFGNNLIESEFYLGRN